MPVSTGATRHSRTSGAWGQVLYTASNGGLDDVPFMFHPFERFYWLHKKDFGSGHTQQGLLLAHHSGITPGAIQ